jgi:prepilin-type N-terminal cleavage/methylation domain-containing protein
MFKGRTIAVRCERDLRGRFGSCPAGFTLIELMVVMGIMALMMGLSAVGYLGIRRGAELRGATASVRTTLMLARQYAITKRETVDLRFITDSSNRIDVILKRTGKIYKTVPLPQGIEFISPPAMLTFYPAGTAGVGGQNSGVEVIELKEKEKYSDSETALQSKKIKVWMLTGITKEIDL